MQLKSRHIIAGALILTSVSCTKNFGDINTNSTIVTNPDIKYLLSYSEEKLATYNGGEWIWEGMEQLFRYTQHVTASPYEITANVNTRYGVYYSQILPNLFEIRRQIAKMDDKDKYQKIGAITYIIQVLHGIKVTDMNDQSHIPRLNRGDTKAITARYMIIRKHCLIPGFQS